MRTLHKLILISSMVFTAFPATAQQGQQPGSEDHDGHHGEVVQGSDQPAADAVMQGQGKDMLEKNCHGGGTMNHCMIGQEGKVNGPVMMDSRMMSGKANGMMHSRAMIEARLDYVKANLGVKDAQVPAWNAYAEAVRTRHATMEGSHADMKKAKEEIGFDCMDARIKATEANLESLKALKPATEALYAALTEEQKDKADKLIGSTCGMM